MKIYLFSLLLLLTSVPALTQTKHDTDQWLLSQLVTDFRQSIITKDSSCFHSLFHHKNITWTGVFKTETQQWRLQQDSLAENFFDNDYQSFFNKLIKKPNVYEEVFCNLVIEHDGSIGFVSFDYSFWTNKKKENWGREIWTVVKANNQWKIASVCFSLQLEEVKPEVAR
ncbi:hypothetical protein QNI16_35515 [Cytophagaceae bacterium YF14B1]|uniref:Nuclear transport factor 2 family protein n=1 Tax=Xanthocytophaga flava TaxID=3048013 RepID=A0AAE3QZ64_9BACT|nr:hypothetical protein [Xanthocytophaga flavus]MDJ1485845.1 hypothetical protein [Xanthocytophaga flavus]